MNVKIYWEWEKTQELLEKIKFSLEELGLNDFINIETTTDKNLASELWIVKTPALVIEEETIDFKDVIFEWLIPESEELKSMFISIIWWWESSMWCSSGMCWSGCSC